MFTPNLINTPSFDVKNEILNIIFTLISQKIDIHQNGILNIVFVNDAHIKELNKNYRNMDSVTDVLSFHYFDDFSDLKSDETA
jgi:probable rRNA maturation factor